MKHKNLCSIKLIIPLCQFNKDNKHFWSGSKNLKEKILNENQNFFFVLCKCLCQDQPIEVFMMENREKFRYIFVKCSCFSTRSLHINRKESKKQNCALLNDIHNTWNSKQVYASTWLAKQIVAQINPKADFSLYHLEETKAYFLQLSLSTV